MPAYDYRCSCGRQGELNRPVENRDDPIPPCDCGGRFKRVMSRLNINMAGAGANQTDPHLQFQFQNLNDD